MNSRRSKRQPRRRDGLGAHAVNRTAWGVAEQHVADLLMDARSYGAAALDILAPDPSSPEQWVGDVMWDLLRTPEFYELLTGTPLRERSGVCPECGGVLIPARRGRPRKYCSRAHKQRAYRRRAGLQAPPREMLSLPKFRALHRLVRAAMEHHPDRLAAMKDERDADDRRRYPELHQAREWLNALSLTPPE